MYVIVLKLVALMLRDIREEGGGGGGGGGGDKQVEALQSRDKNSDTV